MSKVTKQVGSVAVGLCLGSVLPSHASSITGGDAANQAAANAILDIVFAIDTSGSMSDDIAAIGTVAANVIANLDCPDCDVWVRARFMGINGTSGSVFNENLRNYVISRGGTPNINNLEDNGWAVVDLVNHYEWNNDAVGDQDYYKAIVTIGDEGTENGSPVALDDYTAALAANQAAIANGVFLFSWVSDDPFAGVETVFQLMAEGGTNPGAPSNGAHVFGDTGGAYVKQGSNTIEIEKTLEQIICTAATGGTGNVPDGGLTLGMLALGMSGLFGGRRFYKPQA